MSASGRSIPMEGGRGIDLGRALVIGAALAATLSAGFVTGRLTDSGDPRTSVTTIEAPATITPADRPPRHKWSVKPGPHDASREQGARSDALGSAAGRHF